MENITVLNGDGAVRIRTIAKRVDNVVVASMKAMMIELLKSKLSTGVAHFSFLKKDGKIRNAWGTTKPELAFAKTNGKGCSREIYGTTAYFDIEKGARRSFRWESLVQVF